MTPRAPTPQRRISARWNSVPKADRVVTETANASPSLNRRVRRPSAKARRVAAQTSAR